MAKYRLDSVEPRNDGSGMVAFDVWALDSDGAVIPSRHKTVLVPQADVSAAMQLAGAARVAALKNALLANAGPGWDNDGLDAEALVNLQATNAADAVNGWLTLPVEFSL